jgi:thiol reductant ABC exporter CydD subunit
VRPFDPRLAQYARTTRRYLATSAGLGVVSVVLVIVQATLLATAISGVFLDGEGLAQLRGELILLAVVVGVRSGVAWAQEAAALRAAVAVKSELRERLLGHVMRLGPQWLHGARSGEMVTLATRGLDALDVYFSRYLPQVILAALAPAAILFWVLPVDLVAGLTIMLTLPLIPLFMALVGRTTEQLSRRQFAALTRLGHHLLEVIAGLPTLKIFGRAKAQARVIRELTDEQRSLTMRTLRLAFLSSLVLELLATVSVALVAVGIGLRVVSGSLDLRTALIVLILAPEAYLPLRQLGAQYHACAEGLAAAGRLFTLLETPLPAAGARCDVPTPTPIRLDAVTVAYPDRSVPALGPVTLRIDPGEVVAITGPSGCGKSTLVNVVMGFTRPTDGRVLIGDAPSEVELADLDADVWRAQIAYVPQRPYLFAGTVADNIALGPGASQAAVGRAASMAGLGGLPAGLSTVVGEGGKGLSAGQRQRVALARAFLREAPLVVLDEPTASLDSTTEADLVDAIGRLVRGRTAIIVAHRPAILPLAHRVIDISTFRTSRVEVPA